jgi:hypothetical protein
MVRVPHGRDAVFLGCIVAAITLPFLNKPFHIDDPLILRITANVLENPLDPFNGQMNWLGWPMELWNQTTNPPLISYYLAPFAALSGYSEIVLHAAMLPFFLLLGGSLLVLARRFTGTAWLPLLFTLTSVGVVVSGNVMRDVPGTALAAAAVASFVHGVDRTKHRYLVLGSLLTGLAVLMKYSLAVMVPVLALYPLFKRKPLLSLWAVLPVGIFGLWCLHNVVVYGEIHVIEILDRSLPTDSDWRDRLCGAPVIVGSILYLLPAHVVRGVLRRDRIVIAGLPLMLVAAWRGSQFLLEGRADVQYLFWGLTGTGLLFVCLIEGLRRGFPWLAEPRDEEASDSLFLCAWLCAPVLFSVVFTPFQAVRHLIPALPPLVLLSFRYLREAEGGMAAFRGALLLPLLVLQAVVSLLVATADYEYAKAYRDFAAEAREHLSDEIQHTWYVGHWGWQFYAERAGFRQLHATGPLPAPDDLVLWPIHSPAHALLHYNRDFVEGLHAVRKIEVPGTLPLRTMNTAGGGFYSLLSRVKGSLPNVPYRLTRAWPLEVFLVLEVPGED